jgi:hypothetical protein
VLSVLAARGWGEVADNGQLDYIIHSFFSAENSPVRTNSNASIIKVRVTRKEFQQAPTQTAKALETVVSLCSSAAILSIFTASTSSTALIFRSRDTLLESTGNGGLEIALEMVVPK